MSTIKAVYYQMQLNHMTFHEGPNGYREPLCRLCMEGTSETKEQILSRWQKEARAEMEEEEFVSVEEARHERSAERAGDEAVNLWR